MANPQKIKFKTIDQFLTCLPEDELRIVEVLRRLVFGNIPDCTEKLAYNVPFYYRHFRIVFIWPASVPWGAVKRGVVLGFCKGNQLPDLAAADRKTVGRKVFLAVSDINDEEISRLLLEAVRLDERDYKTKRKKEAGLSDRTGLGSLAK